MTSRRARGAILGVLGLSVLGFYPGSRSGNLPTSTSTFPLIEAQILGSCPAEVHDRFDAWAADGNRYRSWHPEKVLMDAGGPEQGHCRFAHDHGDRPLDGAPAPSFGYAAFQGGRPELIRAHAGYTVRVQHSGAGTDWPAGILGVHRDWDVQFWTQGGVREFGALAPRFQDVGFWSRDGAGHETEIHLLGDSGVLSLLGSGTSRKPGSSRMESSAQTLRLSGSVADSWYTPLQHTDGVDAHQPAESSRFRWRNAGGPERICTDVYGRRIPTSWSCKLGLRGFLLQRVASVDSLDDVVAVAERVVESEPASRRPWLPAGSPAGR